MTSRAPARRNFRVSTTSADRTEELATGAGGVDPGIGHDAVDAAPKAAPDTDRRAVRSRAASARTTICRRTASVPAAAGPDGQIDAQPAAVERQRLEPSPSRRDAGQILPAVGRSPQRTKADSGATLEIGLHARRVVEKRFPGGRRCPLADERRQIRPLLSDWACAVTWLLPVSRNDNRLRRRSENRIFAWRHKVALRKDAPRAQPRVCASRASAARRKKPCTILE